MEYNFYDRTLGVLATWFGSPQPLPSSNGARFTSERRGKATVYAKNISPGNQVEVAFEPTSLARRSGVSEEFARSVISALAEATGRAVQINPRFNWPRVGLATEPDLHQMEEQLARLVDSPASADTRPSDTPPPRTATPRKPPREQDLRKSWTVTSLEELGRTRLSRNFFLRDFLHSEIAQHYGLVNAPEDPDLAIETGRSLCEQLLEPLNATFGRLAIRSGYRSPEVNGVGNRNRHNCASNERNRARHLWDHPDVEGCAGATACVVVPWFADEYARGRPWQAMAYWIHNHLPYSEVAFFPKLAAFNITWRERPKRSIYSYIAPKGYLLRGGEADPALAQWYQDFPPFRERT